METAIFAGGCFWCTEAIFQRLKGVNSVVPGYIGGDLEDPTYDQVCAGLSGHAEATKIDFDPNQISYSTLLEVFFATHDSTTLNRQGADIGTQYRSAIFYLTPDQKDLAEKTKSAQPGSVTQIAPATKFYLAENYHQNYFNSHSNAPYCQAVIAPKLRKLLASHGDRLVDPQ